MSQRGFTLIEMSLVMVIVGLMVGGGLLALAPVIDKTRVNQTNATLDQVENALELFVIRNQRLPCPADGKLANTDPNYGFELPAGGNVCSTTPLANAVIPWRTLGMQEAYSVDGWGNRLSYFTSGMFGGFVSTTKNNGVNRPAFAYPTGPFMTVTDAASGQTVTPSATDTDSSKDDQAAYVLISHGKSGWYGWKLSTSTQAPHPSLPPASLTLAKKTCNSAPDTCGNTFYSGSQIGTLPPQNNNYFDDIVRWRSPAFLIQLCGAGSCGNPS